MNIPGLDYNTQREKLKLPEYGREIQNMVDYCVTIPDRKARQRCAESIIAIMDNMTAANRQNVRLYAQNVVLESVHLRLEPECQRLLGVQQGIDIQPAIHQGIVTEHINQGMSVTDSGLCCHVVQVPMTMEPGKERDELVGFAANQMKRDLVMWSHGSSDDEKVADDLARYTDGKIQLDLSKFKFERINVREVKENKKKKK